MISTPVGLYARIRKWVEAAAGVPEQDDVVLTLSQQLELLTAAGAAPYSEITAKVPTYQVHTASAIAAVVAVPTTAIMLGLYNNEPDGGQSVVIDSLAALNVVSTAVVAQAGLLALVGQIRETVPTNAGLTITKMNGKGPGTPNVMTILNATALSAATGVAANWFPWGDNVTKPSAVATPGYQLWKPVDGRIIVAPGRFFAMHVQANVVGETFLAYINFHMKQYNLG